MYILFGAGKFGKQCANYIGWSNIRYFVDNDAGKRDTSATTPVYSFTEMATTLRETDDIIIPSVSRKYESELIQQMEEEGITGYRQWEDVRREIIRRKIEQSPDYIGIHKRAVQWIRENTVPEEGIITTSAVRLPYPEVSGYFIPSLLRWGQRDLAISYAKWLISIQKDDGSWYDTMDKAPYVFDSAPYCKQPRNNRVFIGYF